MSYNLDDKGTEEMLQNLVALGLSTKEARVYIALLPLENVGSSVLIRRSGLHGQFVYAALSRLEELGLAKHVIQNGRKKFSPGSPERILSLVEHKKITAQSVVKQINQSFKGIHEQSFEIYQGQDAFVASQFSLLDSLKIGDTLDVIGGSGDQYVKLLSEQGDAYDKLRTEKGVSVRYLSSSGNREYLRRMQQGRPDFKYRVLANIDQGADISIYNEHVAFNLFGDPVVSFVFKNKQIAQGQKQFFDVLWNLSQK